MFALAIVTYEQWKTWDQRRYEEHFTLPFKRAEYVKELAPMVLDSGNNVAMRSQALASLVETRSISTKSALDFTDKLIRSGMLVENRVSLDTNPRTGRASRQLSAWNRDHFLLDALLQLMPQDLPALIEQISVSTALHEMDGTERDRQAEVSSFFSTLFCKAIAQSRTSDLEFLHDATYLAKWAPTLMRISIDPAIQDAGAFIESPIMGLNIMGHIEGVSNSNLDSAQAAASREYLESIIDFRFRLKDNFRSLDGILKFAGLKNGEDHKNATALHRLGESMFTLLRLKEADAPWIARDAMEKFVGNSWQEDPRLKPAGEYLSWLIERGQWKDSLEADLSENLDWLIQQMIHDADWGEKSDYLSREKALIGFMADAKGSHSDQPPHACAMTLVDRLFALPPDKIEAAHLTGIASRWHAGSD